MLTDTLPPDTKFGFELETVNVDTPTVVESLRKVLNPIDVIYCVRHRENLNAWAAHPEGELRPPNGQACEVKSRLNPPEDEIRKVVAELRNLKCRTTKFCGMHVHVSHPTLPVRVQLPPTEIWEERLREAPNKNGYGYHRRAMGVAQWDDSHVEVRAFNAIVDPDYVLANLNLVFASLKFEKVENDWTSIPIPSSRLNSLTR